MTDIMELAKQSGLTDPDLGDWMTDYGNAENAIRKFAALVAEECAKICDAHTVDDVLVGVGIAQSCAAAIRAKFNIKGES